MARERVGEVTTEERRVEESRGRDARGRGE